MPTMEELANSYKQKPLSMDELAASFKNPSKQSLSSIPEGQSKLPNEDMSGASGWEMENAKWKKIPTFMTKLKATGSAMAESALDFSAALLNSPSAMMKKATKGTFLENPSKEEGMVDTAHKYWSDINKQNAEEYSGLGTSQFIGKVIPELAAFIAVDKGRSLLSKPVEAIGAALKGAKVPYTNLGIPGVNLAGKVVETMAQGPAAVKAAAPFYTKTVASYGTAIGRDLLTFSATEGLKYDPENPEQGFNSDKALELLSDPKWAVGASVAGHRFGTYMENVRKLGKAKETYSPYATSYQLKEQGPPRTLISKALGVLPNLFGVGKLVDQMKSLSADTRDFVGQLLGNPTISRGIDAGELAGKQVQNALKRTKALEDLYWGKVPQQQIIKETQEVKNEIINILDDLKSNAPIDPKFLSSLERFSKKSSFTSGDVKKAHTKIGNILSRLYAHEDVSLMKGSLEEPGVIDRLKISKDNLLNLLQSNLDEAGQASLAKARNISSQNFDLMGIAPVVSKAVDNGVEAMKIADKMISESTSSQAMNPIFEKLSGQGKNIVAKYKILKSLDAHTHPDGSVNLESFLKETGPLTRTKQIMGKDTYIAYQGFLKYLQGVEEAASTGWWTQATITGSALAATGKTSKAAGIIAAVSYPVLGYIANHSPLKTILHAVTRKLSDTAYNTLMKGIEKYLGRGGFYIKDGVLDKHE